MATFTPISLCWALCGVFFSAVRHRGVSFSPCGGVFATHDDTDVIVRCPVRTSLPRNSSPEGVSTPCKLFLAKWTKQKMEVFQTVVFSVLDIDQIADVCNTSPFWTKRDGIARGEEISFTVAPWLFIFASARKQSLDYLRLPMCGSWKMVVKATLFCAMVFFSEVRDIVALVAFVLMARRW